ncbi:MAG: hypothetical protein J0I20_22435 [Chloroflexi bacterium]|nr:hypothetical protein [Chloroflexota bacterium]OJV99134.1 MAG: hypothetical protein BGO39_16905 [Chloroflexi bacterium 54-19]
MDEKLAWDNQVLLVVNCAKSFEEVERERAYICPADKGAYNHRPSRYFGLYHGKGVSAVANIEAAVDVQPDDSTTIRWIGGLGRETDYRMKAVGLANKLRPKNEFPVRVLILGVLQATDFRKDSRGGMAGSTQYFDVSSFGITGAGFLAGKLRGKKWSEIKFIEYKYVEEASPDSPGKYYPLQLWFESIVPDKTRVSLTFSKIEEIINDALPSSARQYTVWWTDKSPGTTHVNAYAWLETGWVVESLSLKSETVTFHRA